jgi:hypothetical protein
MRVLEHIRERKARTKFKNNSQPVNNFWGQSLKIGTARGARRVPKKQEVFLVSVSDIVSVIVTVITFNVPHLVIIDFWIWLRPLWGVEVRVLVYAVRVNLLSV